jgi:hypothetical protein
MLDRTERILLALIVAGIIACAATGQYGPF